MIIIGICLLEEMRMRQLYGSTYEHYRSKTPFLFPLPKWLKTLLVFPIKLLIKRDWPGTRKQAVGIVFMYTVLLIFLSLIWVDFQERQSITTLEIRDSVQATKQIDSLITQLERVDQRRQIDRQINLIGRYGQLAVEPLITLLGHPNSIIREFAVIKLGEIGDTLATDPVISLLIDAEARVGRGAAWTLGKIGAQRAVTPLINRLNQPGSSGMRYSIYTALGEIGSPAVLPILTTAIEDSVWTIHNAALEAMYKIDRERSIKYILEALGHADYRIRRQTVMILLQDPHPATIDALKQLNHDPDYETRFYSRELLDHFENRMPADF
jgi:HEAT repeat protein